MFAHHFKPDNLCIIVDNNGLQIDGAVADDEPLPIPEKLRAFGFKVAEIDGHDLTRWKRPSPRPKEDKGIPCRS